MTTSSISISIIQLRSPSCPPYSLHCRPCLTRRFSPRVRTPRAFLSVASSSCLLDMNRCAQTLLSSI